MKNFTPGTSQPWTLSTQPATESGWTAPQRTENKVRMPVAYQARASISNHHIALSVSGQRDALLSLKEVAWRSIRRRRKSGNISVLPQKDKSFSTTSEVVKLYLFWVPDIFKGVVMEAENKAGSTLWHQLIGNPVSFSIRMWLLSFKAL